MPLNGLLQHTLTRCQLLCQTSGLENMQQQGRQQQPGVPSICTFSEGMHSWTNMLTCCHVALLRPSQPCSRLSVSSLPQ